MLVGLWPAITRRQSPPSPLPRLPALAADECGLWLGARDPEARQHHWQEHSELLDGGGELLDRVFGVAEEHHGLRVQEQRVLDSGEAGVHAALEDDDLLRLIDVQDRHAVDGTSRVV